MSTVVQTNINNSVVVKDTDNKIVEVISVGKQGISGKSAYTIAIENGFEGTEKEWLSSLKGNPFTYSDFTPEQLAQLVGPQGKAGYYYIPSVSKEGILTWTNNGNLNNPNPISIKGPQGIKGEQGNIGPIGETGPKGEKGDKGDKGNTGDIGPRGYTFIPTVSESGDITWTNDGSLPNPIKVNIRGPQGPKGDTGNQGIQGIQGPIGPKGDTGLTGNTGPKGESAIISAVNATIDNNVGTPSVTVDLGGTELNRTFTFNFKNIKGEQGIQGIQGIQGEKGNPFVYSDFTQEQLESLRGPKGDTGEKGDQGLKGDSGINATITNVTASIDNNIGTPSVIVSMGGTPSNRTFNFDFKNLKGNIGNVGEQGPKGDTGISVSNAEINFNNGHLILTLE